jgi:hypothetical protein
MRSSPRCWTSWCLLSVTSAGAGNAWAVVVGGGRHYTAEAARLIT